MRSLRRSEEVYSDPRAMMCGGKDSGACVRWLLSVLLQAGITTARVNFLHTHQSTATLHADCTLSFPSPSFFPNLMTSGNGTGARNAKQIVSSTSRSTDRIRRRSCSSMAGSTALTSTCPPLRTRYGYLSAYDARMISRGFLSVSCSFEET